MHPATVPDGVFWTQPVMPSACAFSSVHARKKTPCTRPWTSKFTDFRIGCWLPIKQLHLAREGARRGLNLRFFDITYLECIENHCRAPSEAAGLHRPAGFLGWSEAQKLNVPKLRQIVTSWQPETILGVAK